MLACVNCEKTYCKEVSLKLLIFSNSWIYCRINGFTLSFTAVNRRIDNMSLSRDLPAARAAFAAGDAEESRRAHAAARTLRAARSSSSSGLNLAGSASDGSPQRERSGSGIASPSPSPVASCEPGHVVADSSVAVAILGAVYDGALLSSASLVASCALGLTTFQTLALTSIVSGAVAAGTAAREYRRRRALVAQWTRERAREAWELENYAEGECAEMVELYVSKGVAEADAEAAVAALSKHSDFFVDLMMTQELGMHPPDAEPLSAALITAACFGGAAAAVIAVALSGRLLLHFGSLILLQEREWLLRPAYHAWTAIFAAVAAAAQSSSSVGSIAGQLSSSAATTWPTVVRWLVKLSDALGGPAAGKAAAALVGPGSHAAGVAVGSAAAAGAAAAPTAAHAFGAAGAGALILLQLLAFGTVIGGLRSVLSTAVEQLPSMQSPASKHKEGSQAAAGPARSGPSRRGGHTPALLASVLVIVTIAALLAVAVSSAEAAQVAASRGEL